MKIVIVGAGISGLTLAVALRRFLPNAQAQIYERDASKYSRTQGYSLGLKGDTGLRVLKTLGLYEPLVYDAIPITNFIFANQGGQTLLELPATGEEKRLTMRVPRQTLSSRRPEASPFTMAKRVRAIGRMAVALRFIWIAARAYQPITSLPAMGWARACASRCWAIRSATWA